MRADLHIMDDRIAKLAEKARALPKSPGVYLMKDDKGRVIYIGKSASLRDRVCSYFQAGTKLEFKKSGLLDHVVDFDVVETDSEVEALLAENRLIKDIQPRYNARLLDDKTFPYLMVTTGDDFPGIYVTREPRTQGVKLYGPFTSVYQLKEAVTLLQKAFKFRTCHLEILENDDKRRFFRPCLLYPIKQCTAPCAAKISKETYREDISRLLRFLDGDKKTILPAMEKEMLEASKNLNFERAARCAMKSRPSRSWARAQERASRNIGSPRRSSPIRRKECSSCRKRWQCPSRRALSRGSTSPTCRAAKWSAAKSASSTACRSKTATAATKSSTGRGTTIT